MSTRKTLNFKSKLAATMVETALTIVIFMMIVVGVIDVLHVCFLNVSSQYALNDALRRINNGEGAVTAMVDDYPVTMMQANNVVAIIKSELVKHKIMKLNAESEQLDHDKCINFPSVEDQELINTEGSIGVMSTISGTSDWFKANPGRRAICNFNCRQDSLAADLVAICFETPMTFFGGAFETRLSGFAIGRNENF